MKKKKDRTGATEAKRRCPIKAATQIKQTNKSGTHPKKQGAAVEQT